MERKRSGGAEIPASVSGFDCPGGAGRLRHARSGHRHRAHRAGPRRGGLSDRAEIWHRSLRADRRTRPLSRRLAGIQRQNRFRGESHRCDAAARSRRAARRTETFAQLSALLALPQSGDFPRHRAMVHRSGRRGERCGRDPAARARGNRQGEMDAGVGRRTHSLDDRGAAGLVRFAAAILGRAAGDSLLRQVRQTV